MQNFQHTILSLLKLLEGNQTSPESITKALEIICSSFTFDCGVVYETDFSAQFRLEERSSSHLSEFPETFSNEEFPLSVQISTEQKSQLYIEECPDNTVGEAQMLHMFHSKTMFLSAVVDEEWHTYGLLLLTTGEKHEKFSAEDLELLSLLMSSLTRYVAVRVYRQKLVQSRLTLENILDNTGIDIYVNDFNNHDILYTNESMAAPYGGKGKFVGKKCWQVLFPGQTGPCEFCPQNNLTDEDGAPTKVYTWDYERSLDGSWFRVFSAAFRWVDGRLAHVVSSADITDNKRNQALVERLANFDHLTGLPNRRMLVKNCEERINEAVDTDHEYLLFFDIDGFKEINDSLGHDAGDEFLIQLGEFFSNIPLLKNSIYRNGGDEFVALIGGETINSDNVSSLAGFIHGRFKRSWKLKKGEVFCSTSIGVARYPEDGKTAEILLQKADMAMYHAKKSGGGRLCFHHEP